LQALLEAHSLWEMVQNPPFPEVGETLGEFHLLEELGRGARGRVFLASQSSLAERLVVLKVTPDLDEEHLSLAQLQHTWIVPLHFVQHFPQRGLRVLCMPWLGGATLESLEQLLAPVAPAQRTGQHLAGAIADCRLPIADWQKKTVSANRQSATCNRQWAESICLIGACLAEALAYAHRRGLVHLEGCPGFYYPGIGTRDHIGCSTGFFNLGWPSWQAQARSRHPGGVNVCFGDGSVRFVSNYIAQATWFAMLSTRDGVPWSFD
jgi:prepilin-type processing-associated H-X9-DG protein